MTDDFRAIHGHMRSGWNTTFMFIRGPLTDRKIKQYIKRGFYSAEYRQARRELQLRNQAKKQARQGNFLERGGRLIFSPV